ncbi:hypothetical protein OIE66_22960 [Nonomuraea sp. NBC_01738]|uniref:hypothetical protein n=1 Tax=Nonomuraea sp. NBC_01738 TaxID=2976003 RepID=UPI002E10C46D|nr:hypothetical protein OIE66_22960 [Nonomuraea sp. NBC_01738]
MTDDERAPSPEEMLRLIEEQQAAASRRFIPDPLLLYVPWGVAWLIGFGMFFLTYGFDGEGIVQLPWEVSLAVLMGCQLMALGLLVLATARSGAHVRGESEQRGAMYGMTWFVGMSAVGLIGSRFADYLPDEQVSLLFTAFLMLMVGVLYMAGGAMYRHWGQFFLGIWVAVIDLIGVTLGPGWHPLLMAVLVGGGAIVAGCWMKWRR